MGGPTVPSVPVTEHLREGELEQELARVEDRRDPPVPVIVRTLLPGELVDVELLGWARAPRGAEGIWGLVRGLREYAPGFWAEFLWWTAADSIRLRPDGVAQPWTGTT